MKRRGLKFIISLVCALGVILFFPKTSGREYHFETAWKEELPRQFFSGDYPDSGSRLFFYKNSRMFGYHTIEGEIVYSEPLVYDAAGSDQYFINYSAVSETLLVKNPLGEIIVTISQPGYPLITKGRLFVFDIDRCGFSEWNFDGEKLWERRYSSIITGFDCSNSDTVVGLLNGEVLLYNEGGDNLYREQSMESRIQVVYANAISPQNRYFAVIQGLDPQMLLLFEAREEGYQPSYSATLNNPLRRERFLQFSGDERFLFYEEDGQLRRLNLKRRSTESFPVFGVPLEVGYSEQYGAHIIHSTRERAAALDFYSEGGFHVNRIFVSPESTVSMTDNALLFQRGGALHRVDMTGAAE